MKSVYARPAAAAATIALALALAGCSDATKKEFGLEANPPDAFQVGTQAPLSLPPELGQLPAPNPGEPPPQQVNAAQQGANIVSPQSALVTPSAGTTPGEQALLQQAGPAPQGDIRAEVNQNALVASKPQGVVSQLVGSGPAPEPVVNAPAEQQRIQENQALGQPVTTGATPQQSDQSPGLFERFLNLF
ncbi:DUF3035 domain-containing protein [Acidocella sp. KAb 2-4]|uniref:DUF3035 domain-containing protein n=1 Tax=Acidocella sp. KAb 2-4 TaxID=2885158 RepID=UPI001D093748|nr:DUF3035 domain-containing protein [Acidocella sp. KAb 2-4]MCB5944585.1 DUF3035 domain-containing protein [Acidocella sp. KAb 2-4]